MNLHCFPSMAKVRSKDQTTNFGQELHRLLLDKFPTYGMSKSFLRIYKVFIYLS